MDYKQQTKTKNEGVRMIARQDKADIIHYTHQIDELIELLNPLLDMTLENTKYTQPKVWIRPLSALSIGRKLPAHGAAYVSEASGDGGLRLIGLIKSDISFMALGITKIMSKYE